MDRNIFTLTEGESGPIIELDPKERDWLRERIKSLALVIYLEIERKAPYKYEIFDSYDVWYGASDSEDFDSSQISGRMNLEEYKMLIALSRPISAKDVFGIEITEFGFDARDFYKKYPKNEDWRHDPKRKFLYQCTEVLECRRNIAKRANILCDPCKAKGLYKVGNTICHINSVYQDPANAWNPDNCYCGCTDCHNEQHNFKERI